MNQAPGGGLRSAGGDALEIDGLSKRFGGELALQGVSLRVRRGEVHGLLGSNGSGKSTLIKILAGFHAPERGAEIRLYGRALDLPVSGAEARARGLAFVHQHLNLIPSLSVAENLFLGVFATERKWAIDWGRTHERATEIFAGFGLALDPRGEVGALSAVERALLAIVRAYQELSAARDAHPEVPGVLVLDEPTPFLPRSGVERLFDLIRRCAALGASVIFVSHDVDDVREITDRATILRDGVFIDTVETATTTHDAFVERIVGRRMAAYRGGAAGRAWREPAAQIERLSGPGFGPVDFEIGRGEILGLAGLIGSGFDEAPARLYGARPETAGRLTLNGHAVDLARLKPKRALAAGMACLPADRFGAAGVGALPVGDNLALPVLRRLARGFGLTARRIEAHGAKLGAGMDVKPNAPALPLAALSGGNAQKALMAKWLQIEPELLLLDEPTQGVDVGARRKIWEALEAAADNGAAILVASTDFEQLALICGRVLIFARGDIVAELAGDDLTKDAIAEHCYRSQTVVA